MQINKIVSLSVWLEYLGSRLGLRLGWCSFCSLRMGLRGCVRLACVEATGAAQVMKLSAAGALELYKTQP